MSAFFFIFIKTSKVEIRELETVEEMLAQLSTMQHLYPDMTLEKYQKNLEHMAVHNYKQLAVFDGQICVGITGFWHNVKLWSGPYLEIDNFVVVPDYRKKGVGKIMTDFIDQKAKTLGCEMIVLDAFVENFNAHKFYYNQGYVPRGYHFIKFVNQAKK